MDIFGRIALLAVLGVLAIPLLGAVRDTGGVMQPGCQLPGHSERFTHLVASHSSLTVKQEPGGDGCRAVLPVHGAAYETPGGQGVEMSNRDLVELPVSDGDPQMATWHTPDGVVSTLGGRLILPFWGVGVGVVMVLGAAGAIVLYGRN